MMLHRLCSYANMYGYTHNLCCEISLQPEDEYWYLFINDAS